MQFPKLLLFCSIWLALVCDATAYAIDKNTEDENALAESARAESSGERSGELITKSPTKEEKSIDLGPEKSVNLKSEPMLPMDRPDWVAADDRLSKTVHRVSVGTELFDTKEACRAQLDEAILKAAHRYANEHLLPENAADRLKQLSISWIRENWLVPGKEWEAVLERPSGTYHQLWVELEIFPEDQKQVMEWFHELEMLRRCVLSLVLCLGVGGITGVLNFGLRFFKRYEKPERQS